MAKVSYTTATLAPEVGAPNTKELRKFLRSDLSGVESVGKGGRYTLEFTATQLNSLRKKYTKWNEEKAAKIEQDAVAAEKALLLKADETPAGAVTEADLEEFDAEFEITDPTDEDLEMIDLEEIDEA